jgi:hypothetical protein
MTPATKAKGATLKLRDERGPDGLTRAEREGPFDPFQLYHFTEIAAPLNISKRQAHRRLYNGTIPYVQLNQRGRRFRGRDLNKFINSRLVTPEG